MSIHVYDAGTPPPATWDLIGQVDATQRRDCPTDGCESRQYRVQFQTEGGNYGARRGWACPGCGALEEDTKP